LSRAPQKQSQAPPPDTGGAQRARIKAVLFDLGETVLCFGRVNARQLFAAGAKSSYEYLKGLGVSVGSFGWYFWRNLVNLRIQRWLSEIRGRDFDSLSLLEKVGTRKGLRLDAEQWRGLGWAWYAPLRAICRVEPDLKETLEALRKMGLKLGIVSNTFVHGSSLERHLQELGVLDFFAVRMYSYEFSFRKPDSRIFRAAVERIGEAPESVLFVGDRVDKDIKPALRAGMFAVLKQAYTNAGKAAPAGVPRIGRLRELPGLIAGINSTAGVD